MKAGLGYEFLSQQYFLDSAALEGPDSTLAAWSLKSTYLDDVKGRLDLRWFPDDGENLELAASLEQTADFMRLKSSGNWRYRPGKNRIDVDGNLEWRERFSATADFGDSYLFGYGRAKAAIPFSNTVYGYTQLRLEGVDFKDQPAGSFDYWRIGGRVGLEKSFEDFSLADIGLLFGGRRIPDSSLMEYVTYGAQVSTFAFLPTGDLDLMARTEFKDYNRPGDEDDHWRHELYGQNRLRLSERWLMRQEFDLEAMLFSANDEINSDYLKLGGAVLAGIEAGGLAVTAGPDLQWLTNSNGSETVDFVGEEYLETGARIDIDYIGADGIFLSAETVFGRHKMKSETELLTNFWYERLFLMGDIRIISVLNLSLLFSAEWEWHEIEQNNAQLYLLSTALTYAF